MNAEPAQPEGLPEGAPSTEPPVLPVAPAVPAPPEPPKRSWLTRLWPPVLLLVLLATGAWLALNHDLAADWLLTRGYHPPAAIQQLVGNDTMTPYAQRLFYVNKPDIEGQADFNRHCSNAQDKVTVLGCYTGNRQGIYIYNITDSRLAGIQQVTAAHEMLHQAYDRLNNSDRTWVNAQLEAYAKTVTDPTLLAKIATYRKTEPHDLVNEYHSVFGTEVRNLPPALEQYYKRYFTDRGKIIDYHDKYQGAFDQRTKEIQDYDAQLDGLKKQIDTNRSAISSQGASLKAQRAQLDAYLAANQTTAYNNAVPGFNQQVTTYKATIAQTNQLINQYNDLVAARNKIAVEEQQLQQAIDSHAATASQQ
ncbi:MAG TPA: hypothetical protein VF466_04660 [Candidatus Saccharimonadales bacterium]